MILSRPLTSVKPLDYSNWCVMSFYFCASGWLFPWTPGSHFGWSSHFKSTCFQTSRPESLTLSTSEFDSLKTITYMGSKRTMLCYETPRYLQDIPILVFHTLIRKWFQWHQSTKSYISSLYSVMRPTVAVIWELLQRTGGGIMGEVCSAEGEKEFTFFCLDPPELVPHLECHEGHVGTSG